MTLFAVDCTEIAQQRMFVEAETPEDAAGVVKGLVLKNGMLLSISTMYSETDFSKPVEVYELIKNTEGEIVVSDKPVLVLTNNEETKDV